MLDFLAVVFIERNISGSGILQNTNTAHRRTYEQRRVPIRRWNALRLKTLPLIINEETASYDIFHPPR